MKSSHNSIKNETSLGAVIIGRNEGERLIRCIQSLQTVQTLVYVDSGSTDKSVKAAAELGVNVIELDLSIAFSAARARNEGYRYLVELYPDMDYIQFVDGDCEVNSNWVNKAETFLKKNPDFAVVCGRRRERFPLNTPYNQLCDIEWDTPLGETKSCGGDAMIRVQSLREVSGYRDSLIAGEEPEMCFRLRQAGWKIMRLDAEMTLHDAAMTRFGQWWKRNKRAGHAYAESYDLHGRSAEKFRKAECRSIFLWAGLLPVLILLMSLWQPVLLMGFFIYPLQIARLSWRYRKRFNNLRLAVLYAGSNVVGKWPQLQGVAEFKINKKLGQRSHLIEYK
ncbi:MAG: glycosyltransferase family 2 protein [Methylophaga sp.]|uniref:glycosyltransferase n=1 Tax=Methylophaga sp. TaxID=2024840 RepID=UPI002171F3C9|nr:glycosyltransferase family 2 protein [Methylophaga sp.]MBL1457682.1 glycosyltransferase family 2 protein [Methylophaga sp.]